MARNNVVRDEVMQNVVYDAEVPGISMVQKSVTLTVTNTDRAKEDVLVDKTNVTEGENVAGAAEAEEDEVAAVRGQPSESQSSDSG